MTATLPDLLRQLVELHGSDLHITTNTPPQVRVHGHLQRLEGSDLTPSDTKMLAYSVLTDAQKKRFEEQLELDFSFGIKGIARFRCNMFNQRGAVGAVYRVIPEKILTFDQLGLPQVPPKGPQFRHALVDLLQVRLTERHHAFTRPASRAANAKNLAGLGQRESESLRPFDEAKFMQHPRRVDAIARRGPGRIREQSLSFIEPDRVCGDARLPGYFTNEHGLSLLCG